MKLKLSAILLLLALQLAEAQTFDRSKYNFVLPSHKDGIYMVGVGGNPRTGDFQSARWGFVDSEGNVLLKPEYEQIGDFAEGFAPVRQRGKYGFIDENCNIVIPCNFTAVGAFNDKGFVWVNQGGKFDVSVPGLVTGGTFGVYNSDGNIVVPVKYKALGTFDRMRARNGRPFVNFSAIPDVIKDMERDAGIFDVHDYTYIDSRMNTPMQMSWDDNIVISLYGTHQKDGIVNSSGEIILPPDKFDEIYAPSEGMIPVSRRSSGALQANYYKVSAGGLMFTNWVNVDCITPFCGGVAIMAVHGKNVFITSAGAKLGSPFDIILPSESEYYVVSQDGKYGLVHNDGNIAIPPSFAVILPMKEGLMLSRKEKNDAIDYIDVTGATVIQTGFDSGTSFRNGCAMVRKGEKWGIIDNTGQTVVSCDFFSIVPPSEANPKRIWVRKEKGGEFYCMDSSCDSLAFSGTFLNVWNFNEHFSGVAFVGSSSGEYGCIDSDGNFIIPTVMDDVTQAINNYSAMLKDGKVRWNETDLWRWKLRRQESSKLHPLGSIINKNEWDY